MGIQYYNPNKVFDPRDIAVAEVFGDAHKLAQWRCKGEGPAYIKNGRKVLYMGSDLNDYLEKCRVVTSDMPE